MYIVFPDILKNACVALHSVHAVTVTCEIPHGEASTRLGLTVEITGIRALHQWVCGISKK